MKHQSRLSPAVTSVIQKVFLLVDRRPSYLSRVLWDMLTVLPAKHLRCVQSFNPEQGDLSNAVVQTLSTSSSNNLCLLSFIADCHRLAFLELLSLPWRTDESAIPQENNLINSANISLS